MTKPISVVICTCDRPDMIGAAVESVLAQAYPKFEVLVLDQSRGDQTQAIVLDLAVRDPRLRYLRLAERGLSRAYNRGVREAAFELLAFTDDDCVAPSDWLELIAAALDGNPDVDLLYGQVLEPSNADSTAVIPTLPIARTERLSRGEGFRVFGMGANFAARRRALLAIGGFDEVLGGGGPLQSAQDFDLAYRLYRAGGVILLEPEVTVRHYGARGLADWPDTIRSYGIGVGGFYFKHVRAGDPYAAFLLARELASGSLRLAKRVLLGQPSLLYRTFLGNVGVGMRRSLAYGIDRRLRLYRVEEATS